MNSIKRSIFSKYAKEDLVIFLEELHLKFQKKKLELQMAREKLQSTRKRLLSAKESVLYQRNRIIELSGNRLTTDKANLQPRTTGNEQRATVNI
jgi:hypothetical protein